MSTETRTLASGATATIIHCDYGQSWAKTAPEAENKHSTDVREVVMYVPGAASHYPHKHLCQFHRELSDVLYRHRMTTSHIVRVLD